MDVQPTLSQTLNDLLAALPEMFPGVQEIPLKNIRPNPDNPGSPITEQEIQELADNLKEKGLLNPIRVQPDHANPFAGGALPHPQNPRLKADLSPEGLAKGDGRPWELADFNFIVLTGQNRYLSADRLQWPTIKGTIHYMTALEANETNRLDNAIRTSRGWWADYQSIELEIKAGPNLTQRQVATRLKMDQPKVNRALQLLPLLNPEARGLIDSNAINSNKGKEGISEIAASWLADLGPGTGLKRGVRKKEPHAGSLLDPAQANQGPRLEASAQLLWPYPPIPPETQDLVRRALAVAIDQGMTEPQVKRLVEAVKGGQKPEDYDPKAVEPPRAPSSPRTAESPSPTLAKGGQGGFSSSSQPTQTPAGTPSTGSGQTGVATPHHVETSPYAKASGDKSGGRSQTPLSADLSPETSVQGEALAKADHNDGKNFQTPNPSLLIGLSKAFHWIGRNTLPLLKSLFGWGKRQVVKSIEKSIKHDIKRRVGMAVKATGLFILMAVGLHIFYPGSLSRLIAWFMNVQPPSMAKTNIPTLEKGGQGGFSSSEPAQSKPVDKTLSGTPSKGSGQAGVVSSPYVKTSGDRSQTPLSADLSPETSVQGEALAKADRNDSNKTTQANAASSSASKTSSSASTQVANSPSAGSTGPPQTNSSSSNKIDPLAKAVGDAAGEAAKKAFNLPF